MRVDVVRSADNHFTSTMTEKKATESVTTTDNKSISPPSARFAGYWIYTLLAADPDLNVLVRETSRCEFDNILTYPGRPRLILSAVKPDFWTEVIQPAVEALRTKILACVPRVNVILTQADKFAFNEAGKFSAPQFLYQITCRPLRGFDATSISVTGQRMFAEQLNRLLEGNPPLSEEQINMQFRKPSNEMTINFCVIL